MAPDPARNKRPRANGSGANPPARTVSGQRGRATIPPIRPDEFDELDLTDLALINRIVIANARKRRSHD